MFAYSLRVEPFEVPPNPILLFDREPTCDQRFKQQDRIDRCNVALVAIGTEDARDHNGVLDVLIQHDGTEGRMDGSPFLLTPELDQSPSFL